MIWIDTQDAFDDAMKRVAAHEKVAVDTEADSLHSYFDKVCLIQISIPGEDLVIDPLRKIDLSAFGAILDDKRITKVLHGADYDLRILNRDFGFTISNVIDTMICAQLLGYEAIGLAALLERYFTITVDKTHQRADWAMRPLPRSMLEYAASDTRNLVALSDKMREELIAIGRWEWAKEEFARLESIRFAEKDVDGEGFRRLKGISALDRRSLAIVRALFARVDGEMYAVPMTHVRETVELRQSARRRVQGREVMLLRDEVVPLLHFREVVGLPEASLVSVDGSTQVIVIECDGRRTGLVVDEFAGEQDIVVKGFDGVRDGLALFSGATILADGAPALIVDVSSLN